jgi:hypothetical protein
VKLSYVQLDGHGVHDPAFDGAPSPETRRTRFDAGGAYSLELVDAVVYVTHRECGRTTIVHLAQCRFALTAELLGVDEQGRLMFPAQLEDYIERKVPGCLVRP